MTFKKLFLIFNLFLLVAETGTPTYSTNSFGSVDDDDTVNPAIIQQQLNELQLFGVKLKHNILHVSLKEDNPTDLGITLASSRELVAHYDVHLDYFTTLSRGHLRLLRCFLRLVSLKIHNQTLDAVTGSILGEILSQHKSTLTFLDLSTAGGFKLTDDGLIAIQQSINSLSQIKTLVLKGQHHLSNNGKSTLSNILSNIVSIEELDLSAMSIGSQVEIQVLSPCSRLTRLNKIDVSNNNLGGDFLISLKFLLNLMEINLSKNQILGKKLRCLPKFTSRSYLNVFNIAHNKIDDEGFNLISTLPNLKNLNISNNQITDEGLNELRDLQNLTMLDICYNRISENGVKLLTQQPQIELSIESLQEDLTSQTLVLNSKSIGPMEVQALANNTALKSLSLNGSQIGASGVQTLAQNTSLTSLCLENNKAREVGAQALAQNTTLTSLSMISNEVGDTGAQSLAGNTTLKSLTLSNNQIGSTGIQALAKNSILTALNLNNNKAGKGGIQTLAKNTTLKSLNLFHNDLGDDEVLTLAQNATLTELNLGKNNIGIVGALFLAQNCTLTSLDLSNFPDNNVRESKVQALVKEIGCSVFSNIVQQYQSPDWDYNNTHSSLSNFRGNTGYPLQTLAQAFLGDYYKKSGYFHNIHSIHCCDKITNKPYHSDASNNLFYPSYSHSYDYNCLSTQDESIILDGLNHINSQVQLSAQNLEQGYKSQLENMRAQALAQAVLGLMGIRVQTLTHYDYESEYMTKVSCLKYTILEWYQNHLENVKLQDVIRKYRTQLDNIKEQNLDLLQDRLLSQNDNKILQPVLYLNYVVAFYYGGSLQNSSYQFFTNPGTYSNQHPIAQAILDLYDRQVGDVRAEFLAQSLTLTSLDLKGNNIGDVGAQALAKNTILRSLNLENNKIGDSGAQALANNTALTSLNLVRNPIGDIGKNALRNNSITRINY